MVGDWQKASVRAKKFINGWGIHKMAPGFYPDANGPIVNGLIFSSGDILDHWGRLDAFESSDYERVTIEATLEG